MFGFLHRVGGMKKNIPLPVFVQGSSAAWRLMVPVLAAALCAPFAWGGSHGEAPSEPSGLFLTWQQDPTTTMTIDWHTGADDEGEAVVRYKKFGTDEWTEKAARSDPYAFSRHWSEEENEAIGEMTVHRVELTGLEPRTEYRFQVGEFERAYSFETIQESIDEEPLVFGAGGDNGTGGGFRDMNRAAMEHDIQFVAIGGDMAYEDGRADRFSTMKRWFEVVRDTLITEEGRVVPIVVGIGNHEMKRPRGGNFYYNFPEFGGREDFENYEDDIDRWRVDNAPYFFSLFAFPGQPGYGVLDFGDYLSLVMPDSDHANPVGGVQQEWLEEVLAERKARQVDHIIPKYHVPGYPSARNPNARTSTKVREKWMPLFEQYGVRVAFENHDHTQKRTYPMREERIDRHNGIVYIGDGSWGRNPRSSNNEWYVKNFESQLHGVIVTLHRNSRHFLMINEKNEVIDEYPRVKGEEDMTMKDLVEARTLGPVFKSGGLSLQVEFAGRTGDISLNTDHSGFSGDAFAGYEDDDSHMSALVWEIEANEAAVYDLRVRYANAGDGERPLEVRVNDETLGDAVMFPVTGSWSSWNTVTVGTAELEEGINTIGLHQIEGRTRGPNVDRMELHPLGESGSE